MINLLRDDLMVQQQLGSEDIPYVEKWRHMVAVIMLNQTGRKPVKTVYPPVSYTHLTLPTKRIV